MVSHALRFDGGVIAAFTAFSNDGVMAPSEDIRITGTLGELIIEYGRGRESSSCGTGSIRKARS